MAIEVVPGETVQQEASESIVRQFNWTDWLQELSASATISTSSWAITGGDGDGALTKDNESIVTGSLKTQVRVIGGTPGKTYKLANTIVTNESPPQTGTRYIYIQVPRHIPR